MRAFFPDRIMTIRGQPELSQRVMPAGEMARSPCRSLAAGRAHPGRALHRLLHADRGRRRRRGGRAAHRPGRRRLDWPKFWRVLRETGLVSAAILFLLIAAGLYSRMLSMAGVPQAIGEMVEHLGLGPYGFLAVFVVDRPADGHDPRQHLDPADHGADRRADRAGDGLRPDPFRHHAIIAVEMGLLTPPFGISVFTVKATLNDPRSASRRSSPAPSPSSPSWAGAGADRAGALARHRAGQVTPC
jgi:C4-dicarboxylate transporter, DctM subunit